MGRLRLDRERAKNSSRGLRNDHDNVQGSARDIAELENTNTVRSGRDYQLAVFHQPDFKVFQKIRRSPFEYLTHDRRVRFCHLYCHVDVVSRRPQDDLPNCGHTANVGRQRLVLTGENEACDIRVVTWHVFDNLKLHDCRLGAVRKLDDILIEHRAVCVRNNANHLGCISRV